MPRTEARIFTSIWRDEAFTALPASAQRLYMFLISQDDLAYCGVIPLRQPRWAKKAAGLTVAEIEHDLKTLEGTAYPSGNPDQQIARTPFVVIDRDSGELLIRSLIRRDGIWKQPNLLKQARDSAEQIESPQIRAALLSELRRLPLDETASELVTRVVAEFIQDLEQSCPNPSAYPSPNPSEEGHDNPSDEPSDDPSQGIGEGYGLSEGVSPNPHSPVPLLPGTRSAPPPASPRERRNGTRLPDDFEVTPDMVAWFREHCPHVDGARETERFRDHWRGKVGRDGRKLDWVATWRNWMRTAEDRAMPRQRNSSRQQESGGQFDRAMERARAREAAT
jgi:hypothetical protein